ncbi:MAG TPA: hypothetical protein VHY91_27195 [Pirellulales bacterium]|jgi:hypothetical protein|nr:hypothetical protein [Pirellulales bacterium]
MALDPYSPCPGGTGKKIKFCCTEFPAELEKLQRMVEGDQRAAALELVDKLAEKYPDRACLLATKFALEADLGHAEQATAVATRFQEKHPDNPVALAALSVSVARHDAPRAVRLLQEAIAKAGNQLPLQVYDALSVLGVALYGTGFIPAARAHWMLQFSFSGGKDEQVLRLIMQLQGSSEIPLMWKDDLQLAEAPADALWRTSFEGSVGKARSGQWLAAADELAALAERAGAWPPITRNLAILRTWLAEPAPAVVAWRQFATADVPRDDAVEAEAMAQLLDPDGAEPADVIKVVYPIRETENLLAQLTVHRQSLSMPGDLRLLAAENEVPPKGYFSLLDRPQPDSAKGLTVDTVPRIVGQVLVYGKQTDREARAELIANRRNLAGSQAALAAIAGNAIGAAGAEEVAGRASGGEDALALEWYLPEDIAAAERRQLLAAGHRQRLLVEWPEVSQQRFSGQTPRQAAADPKLRITVLATILNLEMASDLLVGFDFNELRAALGLPLAEKIDPAGHSVLALPLVRLARLDVAKLGDEDLLIAYDRASQSRFMHAIMLLGRELVGRPSLDAEVDKGAVYAMLAQLASDPEQAAKDLDAGRKIAEAGGKSTARFDLIELAIHMGQGDIRQADRLLKHIRTEHLREPGIAQALYSLLAQWGVIRPDGSPATEVPGDAAGLVVPGAAAAEPASKIWTPGSETAGSGGKKPTIWTPGLD